MRLTATSDNTIVSADTILLSVTTKYHELYAVAARTLLINPDKEQREAYLFLCELLETVVGTLRPGHRVREAHAAGMDLARKKAAPAVLKGLSRFFGYGIGLAQKEELLSVSETNEREVERGMAFHVRVSVSSFHARKERSCLLIADTVIVGEKSNEVLGAAVARRYADVSYEIEERAPEEEKKAVVTGSRERQKIGDIEVGNDTVLLANRTRYKPQEAKSEEKRRKNQAELVERRLQELKQRLGRDKQLGEEQKEATKSLEDLCAYRTARFFPPEAGDGRIYVDKSNEALLLPLGEFGLVPFHISVIKNASMSCEKNWVFLRLNFHVPGSLTTNFSNNLVFPPMLGARRAYIKEMTFKAQNTGVSEGGNVPVRGLAGVFRAIKDLIKKVKNKDKEANDLKEVANQEALVLSKREKKALDKLSLRPHLFGKKTVGSLQVHENGLRFVTSKGA